MSKNKGIPSFFCLAMLLLMQTSNCTNCSGVPSDFDSVLLQATLQTLGAGQSTTITASVPRDTMNEGVTWSFTPGAGAPTPPGTFTVNGVTSATYAAPTGAIAAKFTVLISATSIAFPTEMKTITITVEPTAALAITTTSLPNGTVGTPYPANVQLQASGGVPPYTWSLTNGTALPAGLTLNSNGTITGTPTATGVDNTFTVQVQDSETPPMTASTTPGQLSITILTLLNGNYAFEFSGFNSGGLYVVAGSFSADGVSKISNGVEDVNSIGGTHQNLTFSGTFTINSDDRGQLVFSSLTGSPTYDFAIDSTGAHARMVEFDSTGVRGSGQLELQNTTTCGSSTLSGAGPLGANFVFGLSGATGNFTGVTPGPAALVGRFTAEVPASSTTPGTIDTGEVDINYTGGVITESQSLSGTFQPSSQAASCSMTLTQSVSTMNFSVYPVTSSGGLVTEAFVVETDTVSLTAPFVTVGKMIQQNGYPFTTPSNSFSTPSVGGLSGGVIPSGQSTFVPFVAVAQLNPTGGGPFSLPLFENIGGAATSFTGTTIAADLNPGDSFGRVDTNLATPISPVFYVFGPNEAFCILENISAPVLGIFEPQSTSGFSTSTIAATFAEGTATPGTSATTDFSGVATITSTGTSTATIAATADVSTSLANSSAQAITGAINLSATGTTDGTGSLTLSSPAGFTGQFVIVTPTKIAVISTTTGDTNPILFYLGNCETTCGED